MARSRYDIGMHELLGTMSPNTSTRLGDYGTTAYMGVNAVHLERFEVHQQECRLRPSRLGPQPSRDSIPCGNGGVFDLLRHLALSASTSLPV
ncbi:uncharacterized protein N7469_010901 [Penicillium citrinum]|uniref:Uncharacterized protein n=1 Tax=Penicillium citrinum TaxID=5077 RepID=A0A9W9NL29_PENCI|nr:uncharacterized protein N7469_010901 [Penicillium citrinum]KAJ5222014.1 hypothetical protein N7469_010901 [Penicillium citrinum]